MAEKKATTKAAATKTTAAKKAAEAKKETAEETLGALQYFSKHSAKITHDLEVVDIVGTGGDSKGTFNISTAASFVIASCGIMVAKHGGRSATSKVGSQDFALELQVALQSGQIDSHQIRITSHPSILGSSHLDPQRSIGENQKDMLQIFMGRIKRYFCSSMGSLG